LIGWICGEDGLIIHTIDGENWIQQSTPVTINLYDVFFLDNLLGWSCGEDGTIIHTFDGGQTWEIQETQIYDRKFVSIALTNFYGQIYGFCVGDTCGVSTSDGDEWLGGTSLNMFYDITYWEPQPGGFRACILTNNEMQCTQDYGITWEWVGVFEDLQFGIIRKNKQGFPWITNTWTVGLNGTAYYNHYPGNGYPFFPAITPDTLDLYEGDVDENDSTIWAVGELGEIIYSTDFGFTFQKYVSPTNYNLYDVEFSGTETGWAVGDSGTILKYTGDWTITKTENYIPSKNEMNISVNPNPFTTSTQICYEIENASSVTINVYDYTGKRIRSFDQGKMDKGSHCVEFSSDGLTSAIYFYSLELNGQVSASKKMTVVK
jgi:hypothetical protein